MSCCNFPGAEVSYCHVGRGEADGDSDDAVEVSYIKVKINGLKSLNPITPRDWRKMILIARRAKDIFDLYPWADNPKDLKGTECVNRVKWLSQQPEYPFDEYFYFERRVGYVMNLDQAHASQLLYLCHKVKNNQPFDKEAFCNRLGHRQSSMVNIEGWSCTLL